MIKLTPKEEKFARLYVEIGNASEAYRQTFAVGEETKKESVWRNAHEVLKRPDVSSRVSELQDQAMAVHKITVESLVGELDEIMALAKDHQKLKGKPQLAAAVSAINTKMKLAGLDKTTINHTSDDGTMSPVMDLDFTKLEDNEIVELKRLIQKATR